ncbi:MAG: hypothetical protein K8R87_10985 [Verrucomicrobia bacterium]|nr:hypothetical protein [Verrucomicrobiota bacterium]
MTSEPQRSRQAQRIQDWKPWLKSTGPRTAEGKAKSARNAFKGGHAANLKKLGQFLRTIEDERKKLVH